MSNSVLVLRALIRFSFWTSICFFISLIYSSFLCLTFIEICFCSSSNSCIIPICSLLVYLTSFYILAIFSRDLSRNFFIFSFLAFICLLALFWAIYYFFWVFSCLCYLGLSTLDLKLKDHFSFTCFFIFILNDIS